MEKRCNRNKKLIHNRLYVQAVVDAVNDVVSSRLQGNKLGFVLLDDILFLIRKSWDLVKISNRSVGSVGGNLSGNIGVHAGKLEVNTNIGVVNINGFGSTQVSNVFVVTNGQSGSGNSQTSGGGNGSRKEFTALGGQSSRGTVGRRGNERSNGAVTDKNRTARVRNLLRNSRY